MSREEHGLYVHNWRGMIYQLELTSDIQAEEGIRLVILVVLYRFVNRLERHACKYGAPQISFRAAQPPGPLHMAPRSLSIQVPSSNKSPRPQDMCPARSFAPLYTSPTCRLESICHHSRVLSSLLSSLCPVLMQSFAFAPGPPAHRPANSQQRHLRFIFDRRNGQYRIWS